MSSTPSNTMRGNQTGTVSGGAGAGFGSFGNFNPQWGNNPFNFTKTDSEEQNQNATAGQLGSFVATANNPNVTSAPGQANSFSPNTGLNAADLGRMKGPQQTSSKGGSGLPSNMKFRSR